MVSYNTFTEQARITNIIQHLRLTKSKIDSL